jgi:hypothetical protein
MIAAANGITKLAGETLTILVDFTERLDANELLTGTPTVTQVGLAVTGVAVTTVDLTKDGVEIAAGKGVQLLLAGGTRGYRNWVEVLADTDKGGPDRTGLKFQVTVE